MKRSFADCTQCELMSSQGTPYYTNSSENIKGVDAFLIIDFFDWNLLKPELDKRYQRYLVMKPIICDHNITDKQILSKLVERCMKNASETHARIRPKKVITIGPLSACSFPLPTESYENLDHFLFKDKKMEPAMPKEELVLSEASLMPAADPAKPYMFTIPEKYYTDEYRLIDVQQISMQNRIIYIFRDKKNNREYYEFPMKDNNFYWYESLSNESRIIEPYSNLQLKVDNYKNRNMTLTGYGADYNITTVHSVDYFLNNKSEAPTVKKNIVFFDIEIYAFRDKAFPDPSKAMFPINAISFTSDQPNDIVHVYLLKIDNEIDSAIEKLMAEKKLVNTTVFNDEYSLLSAFFTKLKEYDLDFLTGWNVTHFDIPYIVTRMKKLQMPANAFSPFGNLYADTSGRCIVTGIICLDQLDLFKNDTTRPTQASYSLANIAQLVTGKSKVVYEGSLAELYRSNIAKFVEYSTGDTELLRLIEESVRHVSLQDELRVITTTSHHGASSTTGQAEGLFITSMKKKGFVARNKEQSEDESKLPGAYVFPAKGGLREGIVIDFDFQSLYPSIINSWNLGPDTYLAKITDPQIAFDFIYNRTKLQNAFDIEIIFDPIHNSIPKKVSLTDLEDFIARNKATINVTGSVFCGHEVKESIFYTVVDKIFQGRKQYKKLMLDAKEKGDKINRQIFDGKQMAYKILANSLYGVLGNRHFKFFNIDLAKSITLAGQEILKFSAWHCEQYLQSRGSLAKFTLDSEFALKAESSKEVFYGDTDSLFLYLTEYLKDKGVTPKKSPEVDAEIQKIQKFINEQAIPVFVGLHNIAKTKSLIFLKNEYIFDKFYSLNGKKHYAAKIISQEGRDVKGIEIKGLEMKRSEIPSYSRKLLTKILEMVLDDDPTVREKIQSEVIPAAMKEAYELTKRKDSSIARIVNFSKDLKEYKNVPQHIKGMMIWNKLMGMEEFRHGSKGQLWEITAIDIDKAPKEIQANYHNILLKSYSPSDFTCICVPEETDLPEYIIVNHKAMVDYAIKDRCDNLLEPLIQSYKQEVMEW